MQKIIPHLWFDKEAREATAFYTTVFNNSKVTHITTLKDTPSGDADSISFTLEGQDFMAINGGPFFKLNPSISLFVTFNDEKEIDMVWNKLIEGGKALMPYQKYPWSTKYGWLEDKYGLSWQLSLSEEKGSYQKIAPKLMFTQDKAGKAKEAIEMYTQLFPNSKIEMISTYEKGEGDKEGLIKHSRFMLADQDFMAMDSSLGHQFTFNEAFSLIVNCDTQEEIDFYWQKLSAVPESEQCGWLKDKYGVSWQITPTIMGKMMASGDDEKIKRLTQAFLTMKKLDIKALEAAYEGK